MSTATSSWHLRRVDGEPEAGEHQWVGAAVVHLTSDQAKQAEKRKDGVVRVPDAMIVVLETYCSACRLAYDRRQEPCVVDERLRGGPVGTRRRRSTDEDPEPNEP